MFEEVRKELKEMSDTKLAEFNSKLCPDIDKNIVLGIKIPNLRKKAKEIIASKNFEIYIKEYYEKSFVYLEETIIVGLAIGYSKLKLEDKLEYIKNFITRIDNWIVNDTFCSTLKVKENELEKLWEFIVPYLDSKNQFEVRFAVTTILNNFIREEYVDKAIEKIDKIKNQEYYCEMAMAWTLAEIGIKFNDKAMKYLKGKNNLSDFTFNKTLQKMIESFRISKEQKEELRLMKRKTLKKEV